MSDFFSEVKAAAKAVASAQKNTERAEQALAAARVAETTAWGRLYSIGGVSAETAAQVTGNSPTKCKSEFEASARAIKSHAKPAAGLSTKAGE